MEELGALDGSADEWLMLGPEEEVQEEETAGKEQLAKSRTSNEANETVRFLMRFLLQAYV